MYLEEEYPQPPLLPLDLHKRSINYQAVNIISSSIQPFQNLAVVKGTSDPTYKLSWVPRHIEKGFSALEKLLKPRAGKYAIGDEIFMADLFLAPQLHSAIKRFQIDLSKFPLLSRLNEEYNAITAFQDAMPEKQPDAPPQNSS